MRGVNREFDRYMEAWMRRDEASAEHVIRFDGAVAMLSPRIPHVWSANFVFLERSGIPTAEVLEIGDRSLGEAGMDHRAVLTAEVGDAERLRRELGEEWQLQVSVCMVLRGVADRPATVEAEEA